MKSKTTYTCCDKQIASIKLMKAHLELVHKIDIKTQMFEQRMVSHMDGPTWYASVYQVTGGGVTFTQENWNERDDEDKFLWMDGPEVQE